MLAVGRCSTTTTAAAWKRLLMRSSSSKSSALSNINRAPIYDKRTNETGPGGRGSDAGLKVCIFGASGHLGRYVCSQLGTNGFLTYIANRGDDLEMRFLKPMFELGRSRFVFYSPRDRESMKKVIADADVVINCIGKYYETRALRDEGRKLHYDVNYSYEETNIDIARTIAELCVEMQVDNLIHVSSLTNPDSQSRWARTKYLGEQAVKEVYPWATIIRPCQLFGVEDRLLNWFGNMASMMPFVPLINGGTQLTQPVYSVNVADAISRVVDNPEKYEGRTVDCFGPEDYTYKELAEFVFDITQQKPFVWNTPKEIMMPISKIMQYQGRPFLTPDIVELWTEDFVPTMTQEQYDAQPKETKNYTLKDLNIDPVPIEKIAFNYLYRFRTGGHFTITEGYH